MSTDQSKDAEMHMPLKCYLCGLLFTRSIFHLCLITFEFDSVLMSIGVNIKEF